MDSLALTLILSIPLFGAVLLTLLGHWQGAAWVNSLFSFFTFIISVWLGWEIWQSGPRLFGDKFFYIDSFNIYLVLLTTFVGMMTATFSRAYMAYEVEKGRINAKHTRLYYAMYQGFIFSMLLALTTNNLGVLWVAMEAATLATILLVSLHRTPESIEAAWKYFILCGVGIAQALFGTILVYFAAVLVMTEHHGDGLLWTELHAHSLEPTILSIAFVFLLVGYGTKMGLVPLHNWLPDAYSRAVPMYTILSSLLLNVALYALVRIKVLVDASLNTDLAGYLMMGFGLLSFLVAALLLHRQRNIKRLFGYSSIEHIGLMTFAFGIGTPLATFAALLHMVAHSLTKSAIFMIIGYVSQITGSDNIDKIRGLIRTQPSVGWGLLISTAVIAGFPPFGIFISEFLLLLATMKSWPWLTPFLLIGLGVVFGGLFKHLHPMVYGERPAGQVRVTVNMSLIVIQLLLVLWLGLAMPPFLAFWFEQATYLISGQRL